MTLTEFEAATARWMTMQPGLEIIDAAVINEVRALIAQLDLEANDLAAAKCLLAEIAGHPAPMPGGFSQRCAAFLQAHGGPDY